MGDITKGYTFTAGGEVNAARLNNLVDDATIKADAVTATHLASSCLRTSHLPLSTPSDFQLPPAHIALNENKLILGTASGQASAYEYNTDQFQINGSSIFEVKALDASSVSITNIDPATALNDSGVTAGTYGGDAKSVQFDVNAKGIVTSVTETEVWKSGEEVFGSNTFSAAGAKATFTLLTGLSAPPRAINAWIKITGSVGTFSGGELISINDTFYGDNNNDHYFYAWVKEDAGTYDVYIYSVKSTLACYIKNPGNTNGTIEHIGNATALNSNGSLVWRVRL